MSRALRAVLLPLFLLPLAAAGEWDHNAAFSLKKDRWQSVRIDEGGRIHNLRFRWTLYKNGALVMHVEYDRRKFQPLLYRRYRLDAFRFELYAKADDSSRERFESPYALIVFRAFDEKKREASLDLLIKDYGMSEIFYTEGKK